MTAFTLRDGYKAGHCKQYPDNTSLVYSNLTARGTRKDGVTSTVFFGLQYLISKYLIEEYDKFFAMPKEIAVGRFTRRMDTYLGKGVVSPKEAEDLHDLGYLPMCIKAVPEGTSVPLRIPMMTFHNTDPRFGWLTNALETIISVTMWLPITSATTARDLRKLLLSWAEKTSDNVDFVPFQCHDFSMRGMAGLEAAQMSGAAHLLSFNGTDTLPAIDFLEDYYCADSDQELIGCSVPATEHSVSSLNIGTLMPKIDHLDANDNPVEAAELMFMEELIAKKYPDGIISIVSDTYDFWWVVSKALPILKDKILARDGKVVIRPDSGSPTLIICGDPSHEDECARKGLIECLWDTFGGTINSKGFKELDPHIGAIYGDAITHEIIEEISSQLHDKGFSSTSLVYGIGSYTYQYVTRDTHCMAVKATFGVVDGKDVEIYKDPKTDDGTKKSLRGLIQVYEEDGEIKCRDQVTWEEEKDSLLKVVFLDGAMSEITLSDIRERIQ